MKQIKSLYGLRAIFAAFIFIHHAQDLWQNSKFVSLWTDYLTYFYSGLTFFFILSGFILTYNYIHFFEKRLDISIFKFYLKRIIKIYPIHIITLILSFKVIDIYSFNWTKLLTHIFLSQSFTANPYYYFYFNSLAWFLSDLMLFYLLFPFILRLISKINLNYHYKIVGLILITLAYLAIYILITGKTSNIHYFYYIAPYVRIIDFMTGIIIGLIYIKIGQKIKNNYLLITLIQIISVLLLLILLFYVKYIPAIFRWDLFFIPIYTLIIVSFTFWNGFLSSCASGRIIVNLGKLSMPFIMLHWIIIAYFRIHYFEQINSNPALFTTLIILLLLFISYIYNYSEKICRAFIANRVKK